MTHLTADDWLAYLRIFGAPAATLFPILYGLLQPWYRSWVGRGLIVFSSSVAILLDVGLLRQLLGTDYPSRDFIRVSAIGFVGLGAWLMLVALFRELVREWRRDRE